MNFGTILPTAIVSITLALVFYSIGTWAEKLQGKLKVWHIMLFFLGLVADTTGTALMSAIAEDGCTDPIHMITGLMAIVLMFVHAVWAVITYVRRKENAMRNFSKFSVVVWAFWLIPYLMGVFMRMK